jgi:hypothetical protein
MKSQVDEVYVDLCSHSIACDPLEITSSKSLQRDIETIQSRCCFEGLSFLTKTLPKLGKALDLALTSGQFTIPNEFECSHRNRSIPAFMQEYFNCLFDDSGSLRDEADPLAVKHLRQVLFLAYKLELPYSKKVQAQVLDTFVSNDESLTPISDEETTQILNVASFITETVFKDFDPKDVVPRHGPGAVATGERLEDKWTFARLYSKIHRLYPYYEYFTVGWSRELLDRLDWYLSLARLDKGCAKVVLVPKDSRGPRLISSEPLEFQWIQQGLGRALMRHIESNWITKGRINFTHQETNQQLALNSSVDGLFATLDLKDASDRVSLDLVRKVFSRTPRLLDHLEACRSDATLLPDGRTVSLKKYAPMGSALCFPVEAFCFWVILVAAVSRHYKIQPPLVGKSIYVYGDDIIIPTAWVSLCIQTLTSCQLVVNKNKCCTQGFFRESCGVDAFKGVNVTPLRLRTLWSNRPSDGSAFAAYVSLANSLGREYSSLSDFIWKKLEQVHGVIPYGTTFSSFPCKIVPDAEIAEELNLRLFPHRVNRRYQRIEFNLKVLSSLKKRSKLDSWARLLRNLTSGFGDDPSDVVIPRSTRVKRGWRPVY